MLIKQCRYLHFLGSCCMAIDQFAAAKRPLRCYTKKFSIRPGGRSAVNGWFFPQKIWQWYQLEVPTIYKAYLRAKFQGISPQNMAWNMVLTYLHFRILKFPLINFRLGFSDKTRHDGRLRPLHLQQPGIPPGSGGWCSFSESVIFEVAWWAPW